MMLLSTRVNPPKPLNLSRPPSQQHISLKHLLLHSPLPSPSLPSILPRHGKKPPKLNSRKIVRLLCWIAGFVFVYWCLVNSSHHDSLLNRSEYLSSNGKSYEIVGESELPDYALPVALTDRHGRSKWTISIPSALDFPLHSTDYSDICSQADDVSQHVAELKGHQRPSKQGYYYHESDFVDIAEAQASGLLPRNSAHDTASDQEVCSKSLTYVLDATNAGLGSTMLSLWLAYSLAEQENRAFFIDDTFFAYGNYSSLFTPPPKPLCRPPPKTQIVPCPHQARHLLVSAATTKWTFGAAFNEHFGQREVFDMLRGGYEALFNLGNKDDANHVNERIAELQKQTDQLIGIHIRHGDRRPIEFQYSDSYIPLVKYVEAAQDFSEAVNARVKTLLASDDPDVYHNLEVSGTIRVQDRISLASKTTLGGGGIGWEGGFFKNIFWSVGLPEGVRELQHAGSPKPTKKKKSGEKKPVTKSALAESMSRDYRTHPTEEALVLRELIGRAYLMDLAILGQTDRVVCAVSSSTCRILAVMMGWERAIGKGDWKNIDGGVGRESEWRGLEWW